MSNYSGMSFLRMQESHFRHQETPAFAGVTKNNYLYHPLSDIPEQLQKWIYNMGMSGEMKKSKLLYVIDFQS